MAVKYFAWDDAKNAKLRAGISAVPDASTAGSKPNAMPVAVATAIVKRSAVRSTCSMCPCVRTRLAASYA
jgi:hypothetical protein